MGFFQKLFGGSPKPGKPRPITDEMFQQDVLRSPRPVVVDFYSSTCPPCHVMGGLLNELGPDFADRIEFYKLNVDKNPQTAAKYQIQSVPTLVFFYRGKMVDKIVGLMPLNPLREKLDRLARQK